MQDIVKLFSYGTLQYQDVQQATFGRKLEGKPDILIGFNLSKLKISDPSVIATSGDSEHPILNYSGRATDQISGVVFDITMEELKQADDYEVDDYKRILVELSSGVKAWVYVSKAVNI